MQRKSHQFGINFGNIPIINIRYEYVANLAYLECGKFDMDLRTEPGVLRSPYAIWLTFPEFFLTMLLQRTISGLEAYLKYSVYWELMEKGKHGPAAAKALEHPTRLGKGGAADSLFNELVGFMGKSFPMRRSNGKLWGKTKGFYEEVRNPVFHGYQLKDGKDLKPGIGAMRFVGDIYDWIDGWHDPEKAIKNGRQAFARILPPDQSGA